MSGADRGIGLLDFRACGRGQIVLLQRGLELALDIILTAFDFLDDRLLVVARKRFLEVHEAAVRGTRNRAVVARITAGRADVGLKVRGDAAALVGHLAEERRLVGMAVLARLAVALHAVERGGDQRVGDGDIVIVC